MRDGARQALRALHNQQVARSHSKDFIESVDLHAQARGSDALKASTGLLVDHGGMRIVVERPT